MAIVNHLGTVPNICSTFPTVEELRWRSAGTHAPTEDLGVAPANAYLPLSLKQLIFIHWRVKKWELSYSFSAKQITQTVFVDYGGGDLLTHAYNFSYPEKNAIYEEYLFLLKPIIDDFNEKKLSCFNFLGLIPYAGSNLGGPLAGQSPLAISSTEEIQFPPPDPTENYDYSRSSYSEQILINIWSAWQDIEKVVEFDTGKIGNTYYYPYVIDLILEITNPTTDGLLFIDACEGDDITGDLPPIRGRLTTVPRGIVAESATPSPYKVTIQLSNESDIIELDLFDITEPSLCTNTKFNIDGFSGITIKPKEYWEYDPNDGDGPIYDSATGEQLRPFP